MPPGEILHYRILGRLGRGAMGEVYRAVDQRLGREVALKMLPRDVEGDADWQTRLLREAQAASALNHPGIVTLFDIATSGGRSFLVMELVAGESLAAVARAGATWQRACELVMSAADALHAAHALGILHRDIKSDNLMVTAKGQVKVLDFGLAKLRATDPVVGDPPPVPVVVATPDDITRSAPPANAGLAETLIPLPADGDATSSQPSWRHGLASDLTQAGQMVGTPAYMAPECYDGVADVRSEVFALGVVLYELLAGKRPFDRDNAFATMAAIKLDDPPPPSETAADRGIPASVDAITLQALAKEPDARFQDMAAMMAALRAAVAPVPAPPPVPVVVPAPVPAPRFPVALAAAGAAIVVGGAVAAWYTFLRSSPPGGPPPMLVAASRRLTLAPGCEEYPQFTADGTRVIHDGVVDGNYEILSVALDGGDRRRLTTAPGWDYAAALSPDGTRIAYIHEGTDARTVRVMSADGDTAGAPRDLGAISGYPTWAPDGALVVGDDGGRILRWELGAAGEITDTRVIGQLAAGNRAYHLAVVGTAGVAVMWWTASDSEATGLGELDRGGGVRVIEEATTEQEGGLRASPDGRGYYMTRKGAATGNQLLWRRWGGGAAVAVPGGLSPRAGVDVSRDGHHLAFSTCAENQYLARLRPGAAPQVLARGDWQDGAPLAFDATHVLITSDRLGTPQGWLFDLAAPQSAPRALTPPDSDSASPSRDGRHLVYAAAGGRGGLAMIDVGDGATPPAPRPLTADASDTNPVFTRDGLSVVFARSGTGGVPRLHVVAVAGGEPTPLLADGIQPATSPIDDTVAYVSAVDDAGTRRVMLIDARGSKPWPVPDLPAAAWTRPRWAADGKHLLLLRGLQEVVEVSLDGKSPPVVLWTATTDSVLTADYAPDGDGIIAGLADYDGDLWLADGRFW